MPNKSPVERIARPSVTDRLRIDTYLMCVDWHLEGVTRSAERKAAIRSLREELAGDPRNIRTALSDLGPPNPTQHAMPTRGAKPHMVNRDHHRRGGPPCLLDRLFVLHRRNVRCR